MSPRFDLDCDFRIECPSASGGVGFGWEFVAGPRYGFQRMIWGVQVDDGFVSLVNGQALLDLEYIFPTPLPSLPEFGAWIFAPRRRDPFSHISKAGVFCVKLDENCDAANLRCHVVAPLAVL